MIEALPDEDEPEQSKPADEGRLVCEECSSEYAPEEAGTYTAAVGEPLIITCPSCGGNLTTMSPKTDARPPTVEGIAGADGREGEYFCDLCQTTYETMDKAATCLSKCRDAIANA